jgi:hypothetical protein
MEQYRMQRQMTYSKRMIRQHGKTSVKLIKDRIAYFGKTI